MKAQLIGKNQIRAFISAGEVKERGIDLDSATYHDPSVSSLINDVLLTLKDQIDEHTFKLPHRTEVIPVSDGSLILLITWSAEEREFLNERGATFTPPPAIPGDPNAPGFPPYALPIDELQASVMADILSALSTGNLKEHLKKYLNEDFLEELLQAMSSSGLEEMFSSLLTDGSGDVDQALSDLMDPQEIDDPVSDLQGIPGTGTKKKRIKRTEDCVCVTFKKLSELEKALAKADMADFKGESMLFRSGSSLILVLAPGKLPFKKFEEDIAAFRTIYGGEYRPTAHIAYLSEHAKVIIKKNAVKSLCN